MPEKRTIKKALRDKRQGKAPSTQAGEFVHEEIEHVRRGKHGARSTKQRSEEHTSELQSQSNLVCRLLLEKKKTYFNPQLSSEHQRIPDIRLVIAHFADRFTVVG